MFNRRKKVITLEEGRPAPAFSLRDAAGNEYSLAEALRSGPVVLAFFKVTCPVCQYTLPFMERLYKSFGENAATFLAISQDDALDTREFCTEYGVTFPALIEPDSYEVSNLYGITNVPSIFLIMPDGVMKTSSIGFDRKKLESIASQLASATKKPAMTLFRAGEVVPSFKPG
jgi:peroxiredoxin